MKYAPLTALVMLACVTLLAQPRRVVPLGASGKRVALVVGNDDYRSLPRLANGVRDAQAVRGALTETGFDVILLTNATREAFDEGVNRFVSAIHSGDVALLYYSGHAVQIAGDNYLSPTDLQAANAIQARSRSLRAGEIVEEMESRGADLQIVILDACRNNPFVQDRSIGGAGGLAAMNAGKGTFLAYATAPGSTADDNSAGSNGLYTSYLLSALREPGLTLEQVFKRVTGDVQRASSGRQVPWVSYSVEGDFYFRPGTSNNALTGDLEVEVWRSAQNLNSRAAYDEYLRQFPNGRFATLARLSSSRPPPPVAAVGPPGELRANAKDGQNYVWIPPGRFTMGCSQNDTSCSGDEKPAHEVEITKGFWAGQTEVTAAAWKRYSAATGKPMPPGDDMFGRKLNGAAGDDRVPVVRVTWDQADGFCTWAGMRLPTEAEWEYAARAGDSSPRYGGADSIAWYGDNSGRSRIDTATLFATKSQADQGRLMFQNGNAPHSAKQKLPNRWGLYDMLGNVWEWTADWYGENYYQASEHADPAGPPGGIYRSVRGGAWVNTMEFIRVSARTRLKPAGRGNDIGLRCVGN